MGGWMPCEYCEMQWSGDTKTDQQTDTLHLSAVIWGGPSQRPRARHPSPAKYGMEIPIALRGVPSAEREAVIQTHKEALRPLLCVMLSQRSVDDA